MPPRLELFPFRYRDPVSRKWVKARYAAERQEIGSTGRGRPSFDHASEQNLVPAIRCDLARCSPLL
jgi:hypothetical protein